MGDLSFIDSGRGEITFVFLHFFGGSSRTWTTVINKLSKTSRCIAIDLPGFGNSQLTTNNNSVNYNAACVISAIEKLRLKNFILVGHSMGGKIALAVASLQPAGLQKIILVATSPPTPEPMKDKDRNNLLSAYGDTAALKKIINNITYTTPEKEEINELLEDYKRINEISWRWWLESGSKEDISLQMKKVSSPILVISGQYDKNLSTNFLHNELIKYFPLANFVEIKNTSHLIPVEQPSDLSAAIKTLLISK